MKIARKNIRRPVQSIVCVVTLLITMRGITAEAVEAKIQVIFSGGHETDPKDHGRPVVLVAGALNVKPEVFRKAFSGVTPARGRGPTGDEARRNKDALMKVLRPYKVTNDRLDEVSNYYRYRPERGELWPTTPAKAYAVAENNHIKKIVITQAGSGYSSPPRATVQGFEKVQLTAKIKFDTDLKKNGRVSAVEIVADAKLPDANEIRALIDQLVSPNPPAITGAEDRTAEPDFKLPPGYDREKQKTVHHARSQLKKIGPAAFPYLIERWDDKRYCITMSVGINGYCFNASVGKVCKDLIYDQLQPYGFWPKVDDGEPIGKPKRPGYPALYLHSAKDAMAWYEKNKHKSLFEMQLMVVDWVIDEEAKRPRDFTKKEKRELKAIRDELKQSKKPIERGSYEANDIEE